MIASCCTVPFEGFQNVGKAASRKGCLMKILSFKSSEDIACNMG